MSISIWTVNFLPLIHTPITFTAHMKDLATVTISTQHFFTSVRILQNASKPLISLCNMHEYTSNHHFHKSTTRKRHLNNKHNGSKQSHSVKKL